MEDLKIYYRKINNGDYVHPKDVKVDTLSITHAQIPAEAVAKLNIPVDDLFIYDRVFSIMNHDTANPLSCYHAEGGHQRWVRTNLTHTSMSIGDVICVMGEYMMCDRYGWTTLV